MENQATTPLLTIIVPMYNESATVNIMFSKLIPVLEGITPQWEILCVNDGSRDNTLEILKYCHAQERRISYISLSRNFGKEAALTAGFFHANGQAVIPMDCDLQDPPELIPQLVAKWQEGYKVVLATRRTRSGDGPLKRITA